MEKFKKIIAYIISNEMLTKIILIQVIILLLSFLDSGIEIEIFHRGDLSIDHNDSIELTHKGWYGEKVDIEIKHDDIDMTHKG